MNNEAKEIIQEAAINETQISTKKAPKNNTKTSYEGIVNGPLRLNLRSKASKESTVKAVLSPGTKLKILNFNNNDDTDFYRVEVLAENSPTGQKLLGFCMREYIKVDKVEGNE